MEDTRAAQALTLRCKAFTNQQDPGAGILQLDPQFRQSEPGIERHRDSTHAEKRIEAVIISAAIVGEDGNPVTAPDTQRSEPGREPRDTIGNLSPGVNVRSINDRRMVGADRSGAAEGLYQFDGISPLVSGCSQPSAPVDHTEGQARPAASTCGCVRANHSGRSLQSKYS